MFISYYEKIWRDNENKNEKKQTIGEIKKISHKDIRALWNEPFWKDRAVCVN